MNPFLALILLSSDVYDSVNKKNNLDTRNFTELSGWGSGESICLPPTGWALQSTELQTLCDLGHLLDSYVTHVLHTARISNVESRMHVRIFALLFHLTQGLWSLTYNGSC